MESKIISFENSDKEEIDVDNYDIIININKNIKEIKKRYNVYKLFFIEVFDLNEIINGDLLFIKLSNDLYVCGYLIMKTKNKLLLQLYDDKIKKTEERFKYCKKKYNIEKIEIENIYRRKRLEELIEFIKLNKKDFNKNDFFSKSKNKSSKSKNKSSKKKIIHMFDT